MNDAAQRLAIENAILRSPELTTRFVDVDDAVVSLRDADVFDAAGDVNAKRLQRAVDQLLENKPHLAAGARKSSPATASEEVLARVRRSVGAASVAEEDSSRHETRSEEFEARMRDGISRSTGIR